MMLAEISFFLVEMKGESQKCYKHFDVWASSNQARTDESYFPQ